MSNFVYDVTSLPGGKRNRVDLPAGEDPNEWVQSVEDWNPTIEAILDLRGAILDNLFFGMMPQVAVPAIPTGGSQYFLWVRDSDKHLLYRHAGTDTDLSSGGGGGGTVTSITAGSGLTGGTITTSGTVAMPNVGPGAGTIGGSSSFINSLTLDDQGRITAATTGSVPGTTGQKLINLINCGSRSTNSSTTPLVVSGFFFNPTDYSLQGTSQSIVFRAVVATGNNTVTGHVKLRNVTDSLDVTTLNITGQTLEQKLEQVLTIGSGANQVPGAEKLYEVRIYVDSPSAADDTIELYSADMRITQTIT